MNVVRNGAIAVAVIALMLVVVSISPPDSDVHVRAESWNNGQVYLWHEIKEGPDVSYSVLPDGSSCTRVDDNLYKLGSGQTAIYFEKLSCGGKVGYVYSDQVRR